MGYNKLNKIKKYEKEINFQENVYSQILKTNFCNNNYFSSVGYKINPSTRSIQVFDIWEVD